MYENVLKMYGTQFSSECFKMMSPYDLNVMYIRVVKLKELYHVTETILKLNK